MQLTLSEADESETENPIFVSNLPFHLSGWNGQFELSSDLRNGRKVWIRPSHWHKSYFPLRIIGTSIWFDKEKWVLHRDGDPETVYFVKSLASEDTAIGTWQDNVVVSNEQS